MTKKITKATVKGYAAIENGVVNAYNTIEEITVNSFKTIENGVVGAYKKIESSAVNFGNSLIEEYDKLKQK